MKTNKKLIASILAAVTVIGCGSCGGGRTQTTQAGGDTTTAPANPAGAVATTTEDPNKEFENQIDYDELSNIENVDTTNEAGAGKNYVSGQKAGNLKALCYYEFTNVSPEREILPMFAERFGGTVDVTMCTSLDYMEKLGVFIAAGDSPDLVRYEWEMIPSGIIQNRFTALDDWLDKDSPVWSDMGDIIESFAYNGKHFYFPQTMQANYGVIYSTAMIEEIGGEDPMDLYFSGEWTWDAFEDLMKKWMAQNPDNIGLAKGESTPIHFAATAGVAAIEFNGKEIKNNLNTPAFTKTMQWCENLFKEGYIYDTWRDPGEGFADGKLLFYIMPIEWGLNSCLEVHFKKNLPGECRAVPIPREPGTDTYSILGNTYGYLIPAGAKNVQGAVSWILAGRIYSTDPEVVKEKRDLFLYDGPYYYPKCTKCKHQFDSEKGEEGELCPECNEPRRPKFKVTYDERQLQVLDDMVDPTKFKFLFDCHRGFGMDLRTCIISLVDDPFNGVDSYTKLLEENKNVIETSLQPYRDLITETVG